MIRCWLLEKSAGWSCVSSSLSITWRTPQLYKLLLPSTRSLDSSSGIVLFFARASLCDFFPSLSLDRGALHRHTSRKPTPAISRSRIAKSCCSFSLCAWLFSKNKLISGSCQHFISLIYIDQFFKICIKIKKKYLQLPGTDFNLTGVWGIQYFCLWLSFHLQQSVFFTDLK